MNKGIDKDSVCHCASLQMVGGSEEGVVNEGSEQRTRPGQNCWEYARTDMLN